MNEQDVQKLRTALQGAYDFRKRSFDFHVNALVQLQVAQLTSFQTIGSVGVALLALALGTSFLSINIFSISAVCMLVFLVFFSTSYVRETLDKNALTLKETKEMVTKMTKDAEERITEAFKKDDPNIFYEHVRTQQPPEDTPAPHYIGEFLDFLLFSGIMTSMVGLLASHVGQDYLQDSWVCVPCLILIFIIAALLAFLNWSLPLIESIPRLGKIGTKKQPLEPAEVNLGDT